MIPVVSPRHNSPPVIKMRPARAAAATAGAGRTGAGAGSVPASGRRSGAIRAGRADTDTAQKESQKPKGPRTGSRDRAEAGHEAGQDSSAAATVMQGELASSGTRASGLLVLGGAVGLVVIASWFSRPVAYAIGVALIAGNLYFWTNGQDLGAWLLNMRVMRTNGEVAGFFHMWARNVAAIVSAAPLFAGFLIAFFDKSGLTWHDRLLGTVVINDEPEFGGLRKTSSQVALIVFAVSLAVLGAAAIYWYMRLR